ncbi:hypothetical protein [Moraxella marmotae]|uniref:hypothetical protein n=1 Tax=Moraxella marmotae TaxID=3344520 RepID=UPI0035F3A662
MMMMTVNLIGASAVNFTSDDGSRFDYIKLITLLGNKNGVGSVSQVFKYEAPSTQLQQEFGFVEPDKIYPCEFYGEFKSNGKTADFVVTKVVFKNQQPAKN